LGPKNYKILVGIGLLVFLLTATAWPQKLTKIKSGKKQANVQTEENITLPRPLSAENVDHILAGLSDEQVRRLLLEELKAQALQEAQAGEYLKVRNSDSQRVIVCQVKTDGTVEPML